MKKKSIHLSAEEIVSLIIERPVNKDEFYIFSTSSFLALMSLLSEKLSIKFEHD